MRLITIDPGTHAGLALWDDGVLRTAADVAAAAVAGAVAAWAPDRVVVEDQRVYPGSPVSPASILRLAKIAQGHVSLVPPSIVEWLERGKWGGSAPKRVLHGRALAFLHKDEALLWKGLREDARDAVCIGLVVLGRAQRGLQ